MNQQSRTTFKTTALLLIIAMGVPAMLTAETFTREESREFSAEALQLVSVQGYSGAISVTGWDQPTVVVNVTLTAKADNVADADDIFDSAELSFLEEDGELEVLLKVPGKSGFSWFSFGKTNAPKATITVKVPHTIGLNLKTGSGDLSIVDVSGDLVLKSGSGQVLGKTLSGSIEAETGSGDVNLSDTVGNIVASTGSGSVNIEKMEGTFKAATGSGDINARGQINQFKAATGSGSIAVNSSGILSEDSRAATGSGNVHLQLNNTAGFSLSAKTGSGSIICDFVLIDPVKKKRSLKGATQSEGPALKIATGSGDIHVTQASGSL